MIATFTSGAQVRDFPVARHEELLDDLVHSDRDHPDISLSNEDGWVLSIFPSGLVVFENGLDEDDNAMYLRGTGREEQLQLLRWLNDGQLDDIQALDWADEF